MARIIGVRDLHIAVLNDGTDTIGGTPTWSKPIKVPSLMNLDISDQTENVTFYSDDTVEQLIPAMSGKEITIELGYLHPRIEAIISGNEYKNGIYRQKEGATGKEIAIMFRAPKSKCAGTNTLGVKEAFRYVTLFKGVLARTEEGYQGKQDTIESSNITLTGLFMPLNSNKKVEIRVDNDSTVVNGALGNEEELYKKLVNNYFSGVYMGIDDPNVALLP